MIYTSYFSKLRYMPNTAEIISICRMPPKWYGGKQYLRLAPSWNMLSEWKQGHDEERFKQRYHDEVLHGITPDRAVYFLRRLARKPDIVLLCYERPGDFCHRHLVAEWLSQAGFPCAEMQF